MGMRLHYMNARKAISSFLTAFLIFLCVVPTEHNGVYHKQEKYWICLSPEFNEYQTDAIWTGINVWNSFGIKHFYNGKDSLCSVLIRPIVGKEADNFEKQEGAEYLLGYADYNTNTIYFFMDRIYSLLELKELACHESAHWISLKHTPQSERSIMNAERVYYGPVFKLWPADVKEYCRHWNCKNLNIDELDLDFDDYSEKDAGNDL